MQNTMEHISPLFVFLFWFGLFIVFYTYIGYGILLYALVRIKELFGKKAALILPEPLPDVTLSSPPTMKKTLSAKRWKTAGASPIRPANYISFG